MSSTVWFRFFPSDWLAGTRGMAPAETGIYINLIAMMYEQGGPIPEDHARLARLCGASNSSFRKIIEALVALGKISRVDGGLWNDRVGREQVYRAEKSEAGKHGAERRWQKAKQKQAPGHATAMRQHQSANAESDGKTMPTRNQIPEEEADASSLARVPANDPAGPKPSPRGSRIGEWRPSIDVATRLGMTDGQAALERDKFVDFWLGKAGKDGVKADWEATWRNWCRNAMARYGLSFASARSPPTPSPSQPRSASQRLRDEILRQHGGGIANPPAHDGPEIDGHAERR